MTTFTAKFSTGEVNRTSNHNYVTAAAYVSQKTGEIKNVTFSAGMNPRPSTAGIFCKVERKWYKTSTSYLKALHEEETARNEWKLEVVKL